MEQLLYNFTANGGVGSTAILDFRQVAKEFDTVFLTSEIWPFVFSSKAEKEVLGLATRFTTVMRAMGWDEVRKLNFMPLPC